MVGSPARDNWGAGDSRVPKRLPGHAQIRGKNRLPNYTLILFQAPGICQRKTRQNKGLGGPTGPPRRFRPGDKRQKALAKPRARAVNRWLESTWESAPGPAQPQGDRSDLCEAPYGPLGGKSDLSPSRLRFGGSLEAVHPALVSRLPFHRRIDQPQPIPLRQASRNAPEGLADRRECRGVRAAVPFPQGAARTAAQARRPRGAEK